MSQPFTVKASVCLLEALIQITSSDKEGGNTGNTKSLILFWPQIRDDFIQTATSLSHDTYQIASVVAKLNSALSDTINIS